MSTFLLFPGSWQVDNANLALGEERKAGQKAIARCEVLSRELADLKGELATARNESESPAWCMSGVAPLQGESPK